MRIQKMPPIYAKQILLISHRTFENSGSASAGKFLPRIPQNIGRKVLGTSLPISGAFWGWPRSQTSEHFAGDFQNFEASFGLHLCFRHR